ncbi:hypothetical protein FS837_010894, partial [Tulasnella sp. UAMH 9824]
MAPSTSSLSKANTALAFAPKLHKPAITNAPTTAVDQAKQARDQLRDVKLEVFSSNCADEDSKKLRACWT